MSDFVVDNRDPVVGARTGPARSGRDSQWLADGVVPWFSWGLPSWPSSPLAGRSPHVAAPRPPRSLWHVGPYTIRVDKVPNSLSKAVQDLWAVVDGRKALEVGSQGPYTVSLVNLGSGRSQVVAQFPCPSFPSRFQQGVLASARPSSVQGHNSRLLVFDWEGGYQE